MRCFGCPGAEGFKAADGLPGSQVAVQSLVAFLIPLAAAVVGACGLGVLWPSSCAPLVGGAGGLLGAAAVVATVWRVARRRSGGRKAGKAT